MRLKRNVYMRRVRIGLAKDTFDTWVEGLGMISIRK